MEQLVIDWAKEEAEMAKVVCKIRVGQVNNTEGVLPDDEF